MSLETAITLAKQNPIKQIGRNSISRFAALLVSDSGQEFVGFNRYHSHPLQAKFSHCDEAIYLHCEIDSLVKATRWMARQEGKHYRSINHDYFFAGCSLFVARVLKDGSPSLAKPCLGCQRALIHFGINWENVSWTT